MMKPISVWKQELAGGTHTARLASLYCCSPEQTAAHAARYAAVLDGLEAAFGGQTIPGDTWKVRGGSGYGLHPACRMPGYPCIPAHP